MNFYRHEMTKVKKHLQGLKFFLVIFLARSDAPPTPNRPKTDLRVILKTPILQFKVLLSTYRGRKCAPNAKIFSNWSSYSIRSCSKNFWYHAPPQEPPLRIKKSRFLACRPNFDPQNPGVGGVGAPKSFCHKSTLYRCIISYNITLLT